MRALALGAVMVAAAASSGCGPRDGPALVSRDVVSRDVVPGAASARIACAERGVARPRTWVVRSGDSLRLVARKVYGDERLWEAIREANRARLGPGEVLRVGTELVLPVEGM